ncbi:hypothetical protein J7T55_011535 [Diaporthe amygdali]|uniref:uncharacterized protein n=1 Tax=Phomopsis amygdali TaxID=1214568 RepID=UPI0022FE8940|nr:uncharacterized protein J7T55_011535 [Diaporthe amygdali]KAJ0123072.1 hypothetical protein J7T55_011535 [Diaporthe amygdali]
MRFFAAATFFLAATAAPVDQSETSASGQVEKRLDPITISIITGVTSAAAGWATTEGLNTLKGLIKDTSSWDKVREQFTQDAVARMAANYKSDPSFKGAVCYNQGYMVNDPAKRSDIVSLEVTSGKLKTDYDCFYLKSGGEFKGNGDGGFINIAADTNNGACGYLASNLLMTCQ